MTVNNQASTLKLYEKWGYYRRSYIHNTSLTATNINLNTTQNTKIKGANLQATTQLNINTKNLEVSDCLC
jgi:hypothetical protein